MGGWGSGGVGAYWEGGNRRREETRSGAQLSKGAAFTSAMATSVGDTWGAMSSSRNSRTGARCLGGDATWGGDAG